MQILDVEQGTQEWLDARAGLLSASNSDILLTPTGKPATGAKVENYLNKLIAERLMGKSAESGYMSDAMARGVELEDQARSWYEMARGVYVKECGLVREDDYSCSPDGLIMSGESIAHGLEIKCPLAHTHVSYLRAAKVPTQYIPQLQASMFVCGVDSWDFLSYHPDLEPLLITVARDERWIKSYVSIAEKFLLDVLEQVSRFDLVREAA